MTAIDPVAHLLRQAEAIEAEARARADALRALAAALKTTAPNEARYYTAKTCPAGERPFKRACASGKFTVYKLGREAALKVADFDAWIESSGRKPEPNEEKPVALTQEEQDRAELAAAGVDLRPAANDARPARAGKGARR